jgi:hypothetical protein
MSGRQPIHSPPSSVEVTNGGAISPRTHTYYGVVLNLITSVISLSPINIMPCNNPFIIHRIKK